MDNEEKVINVKLSQLRPFSDSPFGLREDESFVHTVESVKSYGVLVPAIVRPIGNDQFEIISGHRRKRACELAGIKAMPAIVRELDDCSATIMMVDSNLQREETKVHCSSVDFVFTTKF